MPRMHVNVVDSGKHYAVSVGVDMIHFESQQNFATNLKRKRVRTGRPIDRELMGRVQRAVIDTIQVWANEQPLF